MGNAVHEVFVDLTRKTFLLDGKILFDVIRFIGALIDGDFASECLIDEFVRIADGVIGRTHEDAASAEPFHGDGFVCGNNDCLGVGDFVIRQTIFDTYGAVSFDLDGDTAFFRAFTQIFRGHIRMGNAGRAGRNGKQTRHRPCFTGLLPNVCFRTELFLLLMMKQREEFVRVLCRDESVFELRIHEAGRETRENRQMFVTRIIRRGDKEKQAGGIAVE